MSEELEIPAFLREDEISMPIPCEVLDLVRFLAETWTDIDKFVYENCSGDALMKYPVIQGTRNQIDLQKIGEQKYDKEKLRKAVNWIISLD